MKTEFSNEQFEAACPDGIEYHWWSLARSRILARSINAFAGPKANVLEVGCGRGIAVKNLRNAGVNCFGVELTKVRPICGADKHIRVGIDAVELQVQELRYYDTILLLDVIEHIPEPDTFLQNLANAFPNLTHVIITVPARQELWSNYDEFYGHYKRYTIEMLETLASGLCWSLTSKSYFFHLVYLPAWIMSKLKMKRQIRLNPPPQGANRLIHRLISYVMTVDYYLFPKHLAGTSIIVCFHLGEDHCPTEKDRLREVKKSQTLMELQ
jgi:hypothetical protein